MQLTDLFETDKDEILADALAGMERAHLAHYEHSGPACTAEQLKQCYERTEECVRTRRLDPIRTHIERIARDRFAAGYDLGEVQTAINVLEECLWKRVIRRVSPDALAFSLGLITTVLGAAKDTLGRTYVVMAGRAGAPVVDTQALSEGTEASEL